MQGHHYLHEAIAAYEVLLFVLLDRVSQLKFA